MGEWGLLLTLSTVWGGSFFFNAVAVGALPVLVVVATRVGVATLLLSLLLWARGIGMPREARIWAAFLVMGMLNNVIPFCLIVWAQKTISSGTAAILNAATPLFGVLLAHVLTRDERLTPPRLLGTLLGFLGVGVLIGLDGAPQGGHHLGADALCLAAALSYALAGLYGRRFRNSGVAPPAVATGQLAAATLVLLPPTLIAEHPWNLPVPTPGVIAALLGLATVSTALAYVLYFRLLASAGATNLLLVTLLVPISATLLGSLFLGEPLVPHQAAGMALIGAGLVTIDGRLWRRLRRAPQQ